MGRLPTDAGHLETRDRLMMRSCADGTPGTTSTAGAVVIEPPPAAAYVGGASWSRQSAFGRRRPPSGSGYPPLVMPQVGVGCAFDSRPYCASAERTFLESGRWRIRQPWRVRMPHHAHCPQPRAQVGPPSADTARTKRHRDRPADTRRQSQRPRPRHGPVRPERAIERAPWVACAATMRLADSHADRLMHHQQVLPPSAELWWTPAQVIIEGPGPVSMKPW